MGLIYYSEYKYKYWHSQTLKLISSKKTFGIVRETRIYSQEINYKI